MAERNCVSPWNEIMEAPRTCPMCETPITSRYCTGCNTFLLFGLRDGKPAPMFTCVDCGELFASLAPPAETCEDDPAPQCNSCIEKDLDKFDNGPLDDDTAGRIMSKAVLRRKLAKAVNSKMGAFFQ